MNRHLFASLLSAASFFQLNAQQQCIARPLSRPGNISGALSETEQYLSCLQKSSKTPGLAVAVVYKDQVVLLQGYGVRKINSPERVDPDTIFQIASFSKPISSSIVASLVGTGDVNWDDRISLLDPDFHLSDRKVTNQVTIRDLFSQRSGLPAGAADMLEELGYTRPEILSRLSLVPLTGSFRKSYGYTNMGITEAAIAPANKLGRRWEDIAQERMFSRLGMTHSSYRFSDYENSDNKAGLHVYEGSLPVNRYVREADAEAPAGGVSSSARDLSQWLRMQLAGGVWNGETIVEKQALKATHQAVNCTTPDASGTCPAGATSYGLGWDVSFDDRGKKTLSHSGAFLLGASTTVRMSPDDDLGILVLSNAQPVGVPEAIALTFMDLFQFGKTRQPDWFAITNPVLKGYIDAAQNASTDYLKIPKPSSETPAPSLDGLVGRYYNALFGEVQFVREKGSLIMLLPPRGAHVELKHWDGDTYTYYVAGETSAIARRGVKFYGNKVLLEAFVARGDNDAVYNDGIFTRLQ